MLSQSIPFQRNFNFHPYLAEQVRPISNFTDGSLKQLYFQKEPMGSLDAPAQVAFSVELASKLRELNYKWCWSRPIS